MISLLVFGELGGVAVVSAIAGRYVYRKQQAAANRVAVQAAVLKYSENLKPGATRQEVEDYIRGQGIGFTERYEPGGAFSDHSPRPTPKPSTANITCPRI
jgi:hypothetical protein